MFKRLVCGSILCFALAAVTPAQAANCAKRDTVIDRLQEKYAEQLTAGGLQNARSATTVVEVWSSPETGTFTVMVTNAHGISCVVAAGSDWFTQTNKPKVAGQAG